MPAGQYSESCLGLCSTCGAGPCATFFHATSQLYDNPCSETPLRCLRSRDNRASCILRHSRSGAGGGRTCSVRLHTHNLQGIHTALRRCGDTRSRGAHAECLLYGIPFCKVCGDRKEMTVSGRAAAPPQTRGAANWLVPGFRAPLCPLWFRIILASCRSFVSLAILLASRRGCP